MSSQLAHALTLAWHLPRNRHFVFRGGSRNFYKGGGKGAKPRTERRRRERRRGIWGVSPRKFWKIRFDFLQSGIGPIFLGSEWPRISFIIGPLLNKKNSSGHDFDSHTHTHTPHTSKNSSDFGHYKIQIQFQKYFFRRCIQCKKIKLTLPKIGVARAPRPSWIRPGFSRFMGDPDISHVRFTVKITSSTSTQD